MTYILVFISNFLISVTRLLQEDLRWLRDYFSTLSSWNCLGFLLMMMIYVFLWRTILGFIAWGVRILLVKFGFIGKIEWLDKFLARAILKTPLYSNAYSADLYRSSNPTPNLILTATCSGRSLFLCSVLHHSYFRQQ